MITKSAKPILDSQISLFLKSLDASEIFSCEQTSPIKEQKLPFIEDFEHWAKKRQDLVFESLSLWPKMITDGTTAAFLDFAVQYPGRELYVLSGEYPFHKMTGAKSVSRHEEVKPGSRLILSFPFSATGDAHPQLKEILAFCSQNDIKVLIDCALLFISNLKLLHFSQYECVEAVAFSLSKSFCTGRFRIGHCNTRKPWTQAPSADLKDWS